MYFYAPLSLTEKLVTEDYKPGSVPEKISYVVKFLIVFFVISIL
jgi:hypothetical protein